MIRSNVDSLYKFTDTLIVCGWCLEASQITHWLDTRSDFYLGKIDQWTPDQLFQFKRQILDAMGYSTTDQLDIRHLIQGVLDNAFETFKTVEA
jgi:hypothetical protein